MIEERGPIYDVQLLNSLPIGDGGFRQALPNLADLVRVKGVSQRTVAGYEVLLAHYREAMAELERLANPWQPIKDGDCPFGELFWLWDGEHAWVGSRESFGDDWTWCSTRGHFWWDAKALRWDGDRDDDYSEPPTHFARLPTPPSGPLANRWAARGDMDLGGK